MHWIRTTLFNRKFWLSQSHYDKTPSDLTVTVVIPAWNEQDCIAATIESVLAQTKPVSIIVVDDSSTDKTAAFARVYSGIGIDLKVITTKTNQGSKSQALNYALPFVNTDLFICVDADTTLAPDAVEKLIMAFNDTNTMVASGYVVAKNDGNFWESARSGEYQIGQVVAKSAQQNLNTVLVASGCFFAIRTDFLKEHQFDERTMAEDMDLTWVAIELGYRVTFVEDAMCSVVDPHSFKVYDNQVSRWYRGFFQGIKVRNFNLFKKNPKLGIIVYGYMLVNMIGFPLFVGCIGWLIYTSNVQIASTIIAWILALFGYVMIEEWRSGKSVKHSVRNMFNSIAISGIVYYIYVRSAIQELILNQKLDVWVKGH
jgi:cellulose synthase/poly-beta-1,6-N-acetylglucosamine synthase-like glycosyltransferase